MVDETSIDSPIPDSWNIPPENNGFHQFERPERKPSIADKMPEVLSKIRNKDIELGRTMTIESGRVREGSTFIFRTPHRENADLTSGTTETMILLANGAGFFGISSTESDQRNDEFMNHFREVLAAGQFGKPHTNPVIGGPDLAPIRQYDMMGLAKEPLWDNNTGDPQKIQPDETTFNFGTYFVSEKGVFLKTGIQVQNDGRWGYRNGVSPEQSETRLIDGQTKLVTDIDPNLIEKMIKENVSAAKTKKDEEEKAKRRDEQVIVADKIDELLS